MDPYGIALTPLHKRIVRINRDAALLVVNWTKNPIYHTIKFMRAPDERAEVSYAASDIWMRSDKMRSDNQITTQYTVPPGTTLLSGDTLKLTWNTDNFGNTYDIGNNSWHTLPEGGKVEVKLTLKEAKYLEDACEADGVLKAILAKIEEEVDFQIVVSFRKDDD